MKLYVSGALKDRVVNTRKERALYVSDTEFSETDFLTIGYDGELSASIFDEDKLRTLSFRQEDYIDKGIDKINRLCNTRNMSVSHAVKEVINKIKATERNITYVLLNTLYDIIKREKTTGSLLSELYDFSIFVDDLSSLGYISQTQIDIMIRLFMKNKDYNEEIQAEYKRKFKILNEDDLSEDLRTIIKFGEFVSPNRVGIIANDLMREEESIRDFALIYFALQDEKQAQNFLNLCKRPNLDGDIVRKNATLCRAPKNLIDLTRR